MAEPPAGRGEDSEAAPGPRVPVPADRSGADALSRARHLARYSALPDARREPRGTVPLVLLLRASRRLARRLAEDHVSRRASALAFHTLLSVVPIAAVVFAILDAVGGVDGPREMVLFLSRRYLPPEAETAVDAMLPVVADVQVQAIGLLGLLTLLPVAFSMVAQVESTLSDIFRTPRRTRVTRLMLYAAIVASAPMGAVLSAGYGPLMQQTAPVFDRYIGPLLVTWLLLFLVFRFLPGSRVRNRAAAAGSFAATVLLALGKLGFSVYATYLSRSLHLVWGAVAFVPLFLIWVFLSWFLVLLGAELSAVVHELLESLAAPRRPRNPRPPSWQRLRSRRRERRHLRTRSRVASRTVRRGTF